MSPGVAVALIGLGFALAGLHLTGVIIAAVGVALVWTGR